MTKDELLNYIHDLKENSDNKIHFFLKEVLFTGEHNIRELYISKDRCVNLINSNFDNYMYGHFGDLIMTTVISIFKE